MTREGATGRRVAVVTDATSPHYFFPLWHRYYGGLFGPENLFVLTYGKQEEQFAAFRTGLVASIAPHFSDVARVPVMASMVAMLLRRYDVVIRCDVDEFLLADPARHGSLAGLAEEFDASSVTALGLNVIETRLDAELDLAGPPLLAQRRYCVRDGAYCKTAIVREPITWSAGFHNASVPPRFGHLYLFHMKYADIAGRTRWLARMAATCTPPERVHYGGLVDLFMRVTADIGGMPLVDDWSSAGDEAFQRRFMASLQTPAPGETCYRQHCGKEDVALHIPAAFGVPF